MAASVADLAQRASRIQLAVFDVDGVMTDGRLYFGPAGEFMKVFNSRDGHGLKALRRSPVQVAVISGRDSAALRARLRELSIEHASLGVIDKTRPFRQLLDHLKVSPEQTAVMGDDLPDAAIMQAAGLALTVADAEPRIERLAHWVSRYRGGQGAVREACDLLLAASE